MNLNSKALCKVLGLIVLITAGTMFIQQKWMNYIIYKEWARMTGNITVINPDMEKEWMLQLKETNEDVTEKGNIILEKYGYTPQDIGLDPREKIIWILFGTGIGVIGIVCVYEIKARRQVKQRIDELTNYLKLAEQGESKSLLVGSEDEFSILEDEIYKVMGELYQTRETALQEKGILKDHLADIAHQFKTPLTSMEMMCELLEETTEVQERNTYTHQLQMQIERLDSLVGALLTFSKLDANVVQMEQKTVDVYILLLRVLELVEPLALAKGQQIEVEPETDERISFRGDMKWSIEALSNLVKNCIEHTGEGKKIKISYKQTPIYTFISIEDEGTGFNPEDIPHLFKRFYKGKNATAKSVGIGLALAKKIIEKQNGQIEAENREEGGARFMIKIYPKYPCH